MVIDLPSKSLTRVIDLGDIYAPHGVMIDAAGMVWSSGELGNAVLVIDPAGDKVHKIDVGATAHWVAVSHSTGKVFASVKQDHVVAVDSARRAVIDRIKVPHGGGAGNLSDGETLYVCAQTAAEFYVIDARSHALRQTVAIDGADASKRQMRRVRVSPDNNMWWCRPTRITTRRSTRPTASSRSRRFRPRSRPWASASRPTASTDISAATTTRRCSSSSSPAGG